jgi:hypothetical protein
MPSRSQIQYLQQVSALERSYIPKIIRLIKSFRQDFISDLKNNGLNTARNNLQQRVLDEKLTRLLQSIYKTAGLAGARRTWTELQKHVSQKDLNTLYLFYKAMHWFPKGWNYDSKFNKKAVGFGRNERWIAEVLRYLNLHMLGFVQDITDTMRNDILRVLEKGIEEGWGIDDLVTELKKEGLFKARAKVIARTEIIRASNVGHATAAKDLPYEVDKKWNAARDARTRHSHVFINGHIVDENGYFRVPIYKGNKPTGQFDEMLYPGDPTASASNTVNCRCRVTYLPKRDANGRLVMRDRNQAQVIPMRSKPTYSDSQIAAQLKANTFIGVK